MIIEVLETPLEPWQAIVDHQQAHPELSGKVGATSVFVGSMRDFNENASVSSMFLEHYPGMTEKYLENIAEHALQQWDIQDVLVKHRVGELHPDDPIVLIAVWSAHRDGAFEACRYIIEELKHKAPFWKKEQRQQGKHWVKSNTPKT